MFAYVKIHELKRYGFLDELPEELLRDYEYEDYDKMIKVEFLDTDYSVVDDDLPDDWSAITVQFDLPLVGSSFCKGSVARVESTDSYKKESTMAFWLSVLEYHE